MWFFRQHCDISTTLDIRTRLCALEAVAERVTKGTERMMGERGLGEGVAATTWRGTRG